DRPGLTPRPPETRTFLVPHCKRSDTPRRLISQAVKHSTRRGPEMSTLKTLVTAGTVAGGIALALNVGAANAQDVKRDVQDIREDRRDLGQDRRQLYQDRKAGDKDAVKADLKDVKEDRKDLKADQKDRRQDTRDLRRDRRDLRRDVNQTREAYRK